VAAALLVREGSAVVGLTMDLGGAERESGGGCCGLPDAEDARDVARALGIRHYVANYRDEFRKEVIDPFLSDYAEGRTPIPCIACNRVLKFDLLLERAEALGAVGVATGHYARIDRVPAAAGAAAGSRVAGELALYRARDRAKDQTYFLFDVPVDKLSLLRFPLGDLHKSAVRDVARSLELVTADKPESQGICFIPEGDVRSAIERLSPGAREPGPIVDREERVLGEHTGATGHTQGQRKGLGLSGGPWYVTEVRTETNTVVVGRREALMRSRVELERTTWAEGRPPDGEVRVQVRHRHTAVPAKLSNAGQGTVTLELSEPVWAPAPGQAAAVYDTADERLLGGGWISGCV